MQDSKCFQDFLLRHFHKNSSTSPNYDEVRQVSNQSTQLHATAKTHKFDDCSQITTNNLKLRPIISTCGTYFYETAKALSKYLANIFMCKLEKDLLPLETSRFMIGTSMIASPRSRKKIDAPDQLLESWNSKHPYIQFTVEKNPTRFLDTAITVKGEKFTTSA